MRLLILALIAVLGLPAPVEAAALNGSGASGAFRALTKSGKPAILFNYNSIRYCAQRDRRKSAQRAGDHPHQPQR